VSLRKRQLRYAALKMVASTMLSTYCIYEK